MPGRRSREQKELHCLHQIDIGSTALDQLVQDYRPEKERQDAEIAAQRAAKSKERQEALEKDRSRRELELNEREEALARLRSESEQAAAQATKAAELKFDQQLLMLRKDGEADTHVADLRIR